MSDGSGISIDDLVARYESDERLYEECSDRLRELLERVLEGAGLTERLHTVTCRPKEPEKLREKLLKGEGRYSSLDDITDLVGIRVVTYFADDVDAIAEVIEKEFDIDIENSTDKREALEADRFGYLSLHYVCNISVARAALAEYKPFKDIKCEIQVRSILQHAWAEIEHDLGYKTAAGIPADMRRRFSRLAGVLEVADDEFRRLREDLEAYAARVGAEITQDPSKVQIDKDSLIAYLIQDEHAVQLNAQMAAYEEREVDAKVGESYAERLVVWLTHAGLETIQDVQKAVEDEADLMLEHLKLRSSIHKQPKSHLPKGYVLFHLGLVLLARGGDPGQITEGFQKTGWSVIDNEKFAIAAVEDLQQLESTR